MAWPGIRGMEWDLLYTYDYNTTYKRVNFVSEPHSEWEEFGMSLDTAQN